MLCATQPDGVIPIGGLESTLGTNDTLLTTPCWEGVVVDVFGAHQDYLCNMAPKHSAMHPNTKPFSGDKSADRAEDTKK